MLDYTRAAIEKTIADFKKIDYVRNVSTQIIYIAYLLYAVFTPAGKLWADIPLFVLSLAYFIIFLIVTKPNASKNMRKVKKISLTIYKRTKLVVRFFTLLVMLYGIYAATTHVNVWSVVFSSLTIVGWILQVVFDVVLRCFINQFNLIYQGLRADFEEIKKPVTSVGNFFKKMTGQEIAPQPEKTKQRLWLEDQVAENRASKKQAKQEAKQQKREQAKQAKLQLRQQKRERREKELRDAENE